ncbi:hypothetical protein [Algoriphagus confluentis]|uniref:DM13 domain-containing protein n=1 Tax=Algoriphagus confluentis TaxID=1697556 RepID=A0ABQ6PUF3_9BACT|nr:hypothetical protein Aconfl_42410 [Algoriphagus confluentis]
MKTYTLITGLLLSFILSSCGSDSATDTDPSIPDNSQEVSGTVQVIRGGNLTAQSSTNTRGMVDIVKDQQNRYFVRLSDSFTTKFSTGTVTVYLSTGQALNLNSQGSFQLVSVVGKAGEHFFALPSKPDDKFTHGIIWCGAAGIPFGFAPLN